MPNGNYPIAGWWEDLWKTVGDWVKDINQWAGPLGELWDFLVEKGIVTPAQADTGKAEGWTKEEIVALIRAQTVPTWQTYLPWIVTGGLGIGLILVLALRKK